MNHEPSSSYTEPYRRQTRDGDNLEQIIIDTIASARSTVEVAVQELRLPGIVQALADRHQAGVKVRVILENIYSRPYSQFTEDEVARLPSRERDRYQEARRLIDLDSDGQISHSEARQRDALVMLADAQIPQIDDTADGSAGSNLMHDKFVVVDGRTVVLTSANFTTSDVHGDFKAAHSRGNANNLLKIDSPELAHLFIEEFNFMWGDGPGGQLNSRFGIRKSFRPARQVIVGSTLVEVQFSPTSRSIDWTRSSNGLISKILSDAQQSISMALFVFSDQSLVNHLDKVRKRGVAIKTLIDPGFAYRSYSEAMDMMGITLVEDCQFEPNNRPWQPAIATVGVPRMTPGDLLHHKFGIVDHQTVITGSHNWTDAANVGNDETVLVIHNSAVTAHYQREFERLYRNAILGIPPVIQKKADAQRQKCGSIQARIPAKKTIPNHLINLNTATQAELEDLPGVGPSLAKRIIAARQSKRFTSLADLDHVSGVGPKLLRKLEKHVTW
jgi:competence ComEA-like helix-hairpin-helix protein